MTIDYPFLAKQSDPNLDKLWPQLSIVIPTGPKVGAEILPDDYDRPEEIDNEPRCDCGHLFEICNHPNCPCGGDSNDQ